MQAGSTGLGKTALKMKMANESEMDRLPPTKPPEGALVVYCRTHEPVVWNLWIGFEPEDVGALLGFVLKWSTLSFMAKSLVKLAIAKLGFKKKADRVQGEADPVQS